MTSARSLAWHASLALLALACCLHSRYYAASSLEVAATACLALVALALGLPRMRPIGCPAAVVLAAGSAVALLFEPLRPGAALLVVCSASALIPRLPAWIGRAGFAAGAFGVLALLGAGWVPLWVRIELAQPSFDRIEALLGTIVRAVGGEAREISGTLRIGTESGTTGIEVDLYKLAGLFCVLLASFEAALAAIVAGPRAALRRVVPIFASTASYALVRLLALAMAPTLLRPLDVLLDPWLLLASFAPLLAAWAFLLPPPVPDSEAPAAAAPRRTLRHLATCAAGLGALVTAAGFHDAGAPRAGKVLLDESHSDWEDSRVPFDREHWGRASTYNYAELADLIGRHFDLVVHEDGALDAEMLRGVQVLILKTPTRPYDRGELAAILAHVEGGGGLWLVGDHTNLHGMSDILNVLGTRAGMRFRSDAVYDLRTGWTTSNADSPDLHPMSLDTGGLGYQTSCSIEVEGLGVEPALVAWRATAELADYGNPNFFGNMVTELEDRTGVLLQAASGSIGRGRVALFSDSTILSNFALFDRGVSEMALRTLEYLHREERLPKGWREALALLGAALLVAGAGGLLGRGAGTSLASVAWFAAGVAALDGALERRTRASYPFPDCESPASVVAFVQDASSFELSSFIEEAMAAPQMRDPHAPKTDPGTHSISTFFTWVLRLDGVRPRLDRDLGETLRRGANAAIVFEPVREPMPEELHALSHFVASGGRLVVLDDLRNQGGSSANGWLLPFGLSFETVRAEEELHGTRADVDWELTRTVAGLAAVEMVANAMRAGKARSAGVIGLGLSDDTLIVDGGRGFLLDASGRTIGAYARAGRGCAVALSRASMFTNAALGGRFEPKPSTQEMARHKAVLDVLERVLELGEKEREELP
jgi:hypothetical protein